MFLFRVSFPINSPGDSEPFEEANLLRDRLLKAEVPDVSLRYCLPAKGKTNYRWDVEWPIELTPSKMTTAELNEGNCDIWWSGPERRHRTERLEGDVALDLGDGNDLVIGVALDLRGYFVRLIPTLERIE